MPRRFLPVALALCANACATETTTGEAIAYDPCAPIAVVPVGPMSDGQRVAVDTAMDMWRAVWPITEGSGDAASIVPIEFEDAAPFFHGIYLPERGTIVINARLTDPHGLAVTVAHELGHAFGLPHSEDTAGATVMTAGNLVVEPTDADARALEHLWGRCDGQPAPPLELR